MFLLSESTVVVVTMKVWFHGPVGEEVTHCIVTNILGHLAKLEEISGGRREEEEGGGRREEREGKREGEGKEEGENNEWNATVTKENGRGELGQKDRRKESLPGCVTTVMVIHVGREAAHIRSHFSVFSSIPDATTSRGTLMEAGV